MLQALMQSRTVCLKNRCLLSPLYCDFHSKDTMRFTNTFHLNYRSHDRYLLLRFYCGFHARDTVCFRNSCFITAVGPTTDSQNLEVIKEKVQEAPKRKLYITQGFWCSCLDKGIVDQQCDDLEKSAKFHGELISCPFHISRRLGKLIQFWFLILHILGFCFVFMYFSL